MKNKFSTRLKELREEKELTRWGMAQASGIDAMSIIRWETGERTPKMESIIKLCEFFNCSAGYLIGTED